MLVRASENLNFVGTTELLIQYQLVDSDQSSEIISSSAFYDSEHQTVFYQSSSFQLTGISREIARSISTQLDIGSLASGIKEILSANSFLEAARNLNELGYANIDWTEIETVAAETVTHFDMSGEEHIDDYAHADEIYEQYPENHFLEYNVSTNGSSFEESKHRLSELSHNQSSQNSSLIRTNESSVPRRISEPTQHRR